MINIICSEFIKLKRTKILVILIISGICLPLLLMFGCVANDIFIDWSFYATLIELIMFMMLSIVIFSMTISHLFAKEFSGKTASVLYTYPFSRVKIFLSKFFVLILLMSLVYFIQYTLTFLTGVLPRHDKITIGLLLKHAKIYGFSLILQIAIVPVFIMLALITKNSLTAVIFAVIAGGSNLIFYIINTLVNGNIWLPFILPTMPAFYYGEQNVNIGIVGSAGILTFLISITCCISYIRKMDI